MGRGVVMVLILLCVVGDGARGERVGFVEEPLPARAVARLGSHLYRHGHTVSALDWSADGKWLASASWDRTSRVWDTATGREVSRIKLPEIATAVAVAPDKSAVASGYAKRAVVIWDPKTGKEIRRIADNENTPFFLRFSPDGKRLAWVAGRTIRVWDAAAWKEVRTIRPDLLRDDIRPVSISADARRAATVFEHRVDVWDLETGKKVRTLETHPSRVWSVALNRDGSLLATTAGDQALRVFDVNKGALPKEIATGGADDGNWVPAFAGEDRLLIVAGHDGNVWVFDRERGAVKDRFELAGRRDIWVMGMAASPDGKMLATASTDRAIRLWDLSGEKVGRLDWAHGDVIESGVFVDGGNKVATASEDGLLLIWDASSGKRLGRLDGVGYAGLQVAADVAGRAFAVSDENPGLVVFDGVTLKPRAAVRDQLVAMHMVAMSADGSLVAALDRKANVCVIEAKSGAERCRFSINPRQYAEVPVAISPDNRLVAVGAGDPDKDKDVVRLFDAHNGREVNVLGVGAGSRLNADAYGALAFSADGAMLAVAAWGRPIELWEVATGRRRAKVEGDGDAGTCLAMSPNGRYLAAGGGPEKPTVRVWELPAGRLVAKFVGGHQDWLKRVAWSPDSTRVLSCGRDTAAYVWDVAGAVKDVPAIVEKDLDGEKLEKAVAELGSEDAAKAWEAMKVLAARPDRAVETLAAVIGREAQVEAGQGDADKIAALIRELDADTFAAREAAHRELARLGEHAGPAIRQALRTTSSEEVKTRLGLLLAASARSNAVRSEQGLRSARGIEVLKRIDSPAARAALQRIKGGAKAGGSWGGVGARGFSPGAGR